MEKLCFIQFIIKRLVDCLWPFWYVYAINQVLSHLLLSRIKNIDVWKMWFSKYTIKMNGCSFRQVWRQNLGWFLAQHWKTIFIRSFILKPSDRVYILLKKRTRDFRNSPPFERSACFYVTICENFKRFQYFNFETDFLENKNIFQKTWVPFFSWKH